MEADCMKRNSANIFPLTRFLISVVMEKRLNFVLSDFYGGTLGSLPTDGDLVN